MADKVFSKITNPGVLTAELKAAGFKLSGVSTVGPPDNKTTVHLDAGESKDPATIVNAHVYTPPVISKPIDQEKLKAKLKQAGVISSFSEIE